MKNFFYQSMLIFVLLGGTLAQTRAADEYEISTVVGTGAPGRGDVCDGISSATNVALTSPYGVAVDSEGNLYIAIYYGNQVCKVDVGGIISAVMAISHSNGVAFDRFGNLYIAGYNQIYKRSPDGTITPVAGNGDFGVPPDGMSALKAPLGYQYVMTADSEGNLYIAAPGNDHHRVYKVDTNGILHYFAGSGIGGFSGDGGAATAARLNSPTGLALGRANDLYIADNKNQRIRRVDMTNGIITTFAGTGASGFGGDGGPATAAQFAFPSDPNDNSLPIGMVMDNAGNLFVSDAGNQRVRKIDANGIITTIAGNGTAGFCGDGGPATEACLNTPLGLARNENTGELYIADKDNFRVRKLTPSCIGPDCCTKPICIEPASLSFDNSLPISQQAVDSDALQACGLVKGEPVIDVMVVYTPEAEDEVRKVERDIDAEIREAVIQTNLAYVNSGISQRLRLVYAKEVNYASSDKRINLKDELQALIDGKIADVHGLREEYHADLVSLWVARRADECGRASRMKNKAISFKSKAFSVVSWECAIAQYSFSHELAHNMGAHHNIANADGEITLFPDSHAYAYTNGSKDSWCTILGSRPSTTRYFHRRIPFFSNPDILYKGIPMGDDDADNRKTLNDTALTVAAFEGSSNPPDEESQQFTIHNNHTEVLVMDLVQIERNTPWITSVCPYRTKEISPGGSATITVTVDYSLAPEGKSSRYLKIISKDFIRVNQGGDYPSIDIFVNKNITDTTTDGDKQLVDADYDASTGIIQLAVEVPNDSGGIVYWVTLIPNAQPQGAVAGLGIGSKFDIDLSSLYALFPRPPGMLSLYNLQNGSIHVPVIDVPDQNGRKILYELEMVPVPAAVSDRFQFEVSEMVPVE